MGRSILSALEFKTFLKSKNFKTEKEALALIKMMSGGSEDFALFKEIVRHHPDFQEYMNFMYGFNVMKEGLK